ncbi:ATP-binding protein [Marinospirillum sp.]|uniref:sensor histidine kinase n=1 Tax=Marinospirillum sp. TaxID=2183934 RepID=UPI0038515A2B
MKGNITRSLAWRQTRWTLLAAVLLGLAMSLLLIFVDLQQTRSNIQDSTQELLRTTANAATQAAYTLDATLAEEVLEGLFAVQAVSSGTLVTERDRVLASRDRRQEQKTPTLGGLLGKELSFRQPLVWNNTFTGDQQEVGELQITLNGGIAGSDFTRRVWWELIFGVIRNVLLAFVILFISKQLLTQPLGQLAAQIRHRNTHDFTPLMPLPGHEKDEIGQVIQAFNELVSSLKQSNLEMERLNEVMAHHFQEPARRLVSFAQRLENKADGQEDAESRQSLIFIQEQALRLSNLVKDVQRYLALEQLRLPPERLHPIRIFAEMVKETGLREDRLQVSLEGDEVTAVFPKRRLQEVFSILLDNALLYAGSQPTLKLQVKAVLCGDRVQVSFADNGQGIRPEYRQQVFELFTRLVPNHKDYPGTGMGLALVKKVVLQHSGEVKAVESELGGACFIFDLPADGVENHDG